MEQLRFICRVAVIAGAGADCRGFKNLAGRSTIFNEHVAVFTPGDLSLREEDHLSGKYNE